MKTIKSLFFIAAFVAIAPAYGDGHDACMTCHEAADFKGMSADAIAAFIKAGGNRAHREFSTWEDEEIEAIASELVDD